jgi:NAD-dependent SIR2 family protein deacetylase
VLETGPGAWEKAAVGEKKLNKNKKYVRTTMAKAIPTPTHMALIGLMNSGYLKFIISQNVDGLHRKSGVLPENITELHGNTNLELCS